MTLLIRLLPVGNNFATSLAAGVSRVPARPFLLGSLLGYMPQTMVFALAGSGVEMGAEPARRARGAVLRRLRCDRHLAVPPLPPRQVAGRGRGEGDLKQDRALLALLPAGRCSRWPRSGCGRCWPVDETRYASVAWEMWLRGDFLVPFRNGEPYSHKPPLLFWLMHAGWALFGVNDWWPRLVAPLCALGRCALAAAGLRGCCGRRSENQPWWLRWVLFGTLLFAALRHARR